MSTVFHLNNKEAKRVLEVNYNNGILPFCCEAKYLGATLDRSLTYRRHLESLRKCWHHASHSWGDLLALLWLGCWNNDVANNHLSPGPLNSRVLRSCMVPQCSHPPHLSCHQRRLANYDWHPTCWASSQRTYTVFYTPCNGGWTSAPHHPRICIYWLRKTIVILQQLCLRFLSN